MSHYDAIVIGAGHNGLTTANYLARGGMRVCVLEQRSIVGGAAVTEEFYPAYRNSTFSYVVSLLRPEVVEDLRDMGWTLLEDAMRSEIAAEPDDVKQFSAECRFWVVENSG